MRVSSALGLERSVLEPEDVALVLPKPVLQKAKALLALPHQALQQHVPAAPSRFAPCLHNLPLVQLENAGCAQWGAQDGVGSREIKWYTN